jgi:hypothetical protein
MATSPYLTDETVLGASTDSMGLERQRKLAQALTSQAFNQPQGQMISGHYVAPSWTQQLAPALSAAVGLGMNESLDKKQLALAEALRGKQQEVMQAWSQAKTPQEKFAIGTSQYAPKELQAASYEMLKTQKVGKGETISQMDFATGKYQPLLEGAPDLPDVIQYAISVGGLPPNPNSWNDQQRMIAKQLVESKAKSGAAGGTNIINQMGKSIAGEVGPIMKEAQGVAQAAVKTEDSANRIIQAVNSNKLFTGTGANVRLGAAQLANTLGVGGDTLEQKIGNTRQTMQGLAELTLQGRQQMRGQGAITESESKLAERAISGDITFTPTEIKQLANAAKRASEYTYNTYQSKLGEMAKSEDTRGLVPYYQVPRMTPPVDKGLPSESAIDAEIARRQGRK